MPRLLTMTLSLPCWLALLTGCAGVAPAPRLLVQPKLVQLTIDPSLFVCADDPAIPADGTQRDVAGYIVDLHEAGEDCRRQLRKAGEAVSRDPKVK